MTEKTVDLAVKFSNLTEDQAASLVGLIKYFEVLGEQNLTKEISIHCDGSGNFKPTVAFVVNNNPVEINAEDVEYTLEEETDTIMRFILE